MSNINLSAGVRSNLLSLQGTQQMLSQTQERLGTGLKVNSPLDDASAFFTSRGLSNRANDLSSIMQGMQNGVKTLDAASQGLDGISKTIESMIGTVRQARQDSEVDSKELALDTFGVDGEFENTTSTSASLTVTLDDGTNTSALTATVAAGETITVQQAVDQLNNDEDKPEDIRFTVNDENQIVVNNTSNVDYTVSNSDAMGVDELPAPGTPNLEAATMPNREAFAQSFNELRTELEQISRDSGYNGVNLLQGESLEVIFNELTGADQSKIDIEARKSDGTDFGAVTNNSLFAGDDANPAADFATAATFSDDEELDKMIVGLQNGLGEVRSLSQQFGTQQTIVENRENFTKSIINTLKDGSDELVLADMNEEASNSLALQTRQQIGQSALSLSNQTDQAVLQLLR